MNDNQTARPPQHPGGKRGKAWQDYEAVACYVLQQMGKRFGIAEMQGKQKIAGRRSGTTWEIDAKGILDDGVGIVLVECRRYKNSLTQEAVAAVAYRVEDTGAASGITVSPLPLQKGAAKVAAASHIEHVQLRPESTRDQWIAQIGTVVHIGITDTLTAGVTDSVNIKVHERNGNVIREINI